MTVSELLMKPGRFNVRLRQDAPYSVWAAAREFDHIVITPTRLEPVSEFSDANILASAIYTGVITGKPSPIEFEGQGLAWWLATDEGLGDIIDSAIANTGATLSTWVTSLRPASLSAGTVTNTGTTLSHAFQWTSRREALAYICRAVGAEWRINPNATLDAAAPATLFTNYTTPKALITRNPQGDEGSILGIDTSLAINSRDIQGYATKVIVAGQLGDGSKVANGSATGANVYVDFLNGNVLMERLVDAPTIPASVVTNYATAVLNLYATVRRKVQLSSQTYAVPMKVKPGDNVWVYDPRADLIDTANQLVWHGELISPIKLRCYGYTWPVVRGMGVYARRSGATPVYTDLTDFIEWEDGTDTYWEVGSTDSDPSLDAAQLTDAFLPASQSAVNRITGAATATFTAVLRQNGVAVAATTNQARYQWNDNMVTMTLTMTATAAGTVNTAVTILPTGLPAPAATMTNIGVWTFLDVSAAILYGGWVGWDGTTLTFVKDGATTTQALGQLPNLALANTDKITMTCHYPTV